ncbi:MAG TPA: NUDIX domain-containing protein [Ktedonobacterales bacterium]
MLIIEGSRVGKEGRLSVGCAAAIFDEAQERVLLTRRSDNARWCLPGGRMESGENAGECCAREVFEETGLVVEIGRLIGVYTSPDWLIAYADGNRYQLVSFCFAAKVAGGALQLSDETLEYGYFSWQEIEHLDVIDNHRERIADAFAHNPTTFVR